jgi:hypothetical protein
MRFSTGSEAWTVIDVRCLETLEDGSIVTSNLDDDVTPSTHFYQVIGREGEVLGDFETLRTLGEFLRQRA